MCTTITFKTQDGSVIHGRTDEFGIYYHNDLVLFPRNFDFYNTLAGEGSKKIVSKYAMFATNIGKVLGEEMSKDEIVNDGLNEAGLSMSMQYYPGQAKYKVVKSIAEDEIDFGAICRIVLATCATVKEARDLIESYQGKIVVQVNAPGHIFFIDKSGDTIVVEPDEPGYVTVYDKTNGIMTNSPSYQFHLLNLQQYVNLQQIDGNFPSAIRGLDGEDLHAHGTSGAFGLPGDTSPASRFIKASYLRDTTTKKDLITAGDGILRMFRILNNFDVVPGMSLKKVGSGQGEGGVSPFANPVDFENVSAGHTDHSEVKDLANGRYYYNTHNNQSPRYVEFSDYDLDAKDVYRIPMCDDGIDLYQKVTLK